MRFWTMTGLLALTLSAAAAQEMSNGQQEYLNSCAVCHGVDGTGGSTRRSTAAALFPSMASVTCRSGAISSCPMT